MTVLDSRIFPYLQEAMASPSELDWDDRVVDGSDHLPVLLSHFKLIGVQRLAHLDYLLSFFLVSDVVRGLELALHSEAIAVHVSSRATIVRVAAWMTVVEASHAHALVSFKPACSALVPLLLPMDFPMCYVCANTFDLFLLLFLRLVFLLRLLFFFRLLLLFGLVFFLGLLLLFRFIFYLRFRLFLGLVFFFLFVCFLRFFFLVRLILPLCIGILFRLNFILRLLLSFRLLRLLWRRLLVLVLAVFLLVFFLCVFLLLLLIVLLLLLRLLIRMIFLLYRQSDL